MFIRSALQADYVQKLTFLFLAITRSAARLLRAQATRKPPFSPSEYSSEDDAAVQDITPLSLTLRFEP